MRTLEIAWIALLVGWFPLNASAEETVGTLTLDGLSLVSFQDREIYSLEPGSTLKFHFSEPEPDGSIPFTLAPADVSIPPIALPGGKTLVYALASPTSGIVRPTQDGRRIDFNATVAATIAEPGGGRGTFFYTFPLTTESASATDRRGTGSVAVTGMRLSDGVWHVQLVGATTNRENAFPAPGTAVYTVLSGQFDQIP